MRVPKWALFLVGLGPLVGLFALLVWGMARGDSGRGLAVFDSSGEAAVVQEIPTDFTLEVFNGPSLVLADVIGQQIVMVDFWGSWCVPCRREAATLERVWREYKDKGVLFIGIDVFDTDAKARAFIREFDVSYPTGPDPKGKIAVSYGLTGVPEKFFIDRRGRVVRRLVGPMTEERLAGVLDELLALPPAPRASGSPLP